MSTSTVDPDVMSMADTPVNNVNLSDIGYVLSFTKITDIQDENEKIKAKIRELFESAVNEHNIRIVKESVACKNKSEITSDKVHHETEYRLFCAPEETLEKEAERMKLEIPIKKLTVQLDRNVLFSCFAQTFEDEQTFDNVSMPFLQAKKHLFANVEGSNSLFTNTNKIYLTYTLLTSINIVEKIETLYYQVENENEESFISNLTNKSWVNCCDCLKKCKCPTPTQVHYIGLDQLIKCGVFDDGYALHTKTKKWVLSENSFSCACRNNYAIPTDKTFYKDPIKVLKNTWVCCKYQPLRCIRNYFGEKLAFYYAWFGFLTYSVGILAVLGLIFFFYGIGHSINVFKTQNVTVAQNSTLLSNLETFVNNLFNNQSTVVFAVIVCLWGTFVVEIWNRQQNNLAYRWDVNNYVKAENRRPEYLIPRTENYNKNKTNRKMYSSANTTFQRTVVAISFIFATIVVIFAVVFSIQLFRAIEETLLCDKSDNNNNFAECFLRATVLPIALQSIFIFILDIIYIRVAKWLTNKENHEYMSDFEKSYAIKVFLCQFANNYSPLFYIAFFRQGTIQLYVSGTVVKDQCKLGLHFNCFSQLTITTAGYMISKSVMKTIKDVLIPLIMNLITNNFSYQLNKFSKSCCCCCCKNKVRNFTENLCALNEENNLKCHKKWSKEKKKNYKLKHHIITERNKMPCTSLLMEEYVEKSILYGYLMIFGASFTLGPLIVFIVLIFDLRSDAHRLLFQYRRPIPFQSSGIGVWQDVVTLLNYIGIGVTGAILAFTADILQHYDSKLSGNIQAQLLFFIAFENAMFLIKFLLKFAINDTPHIIIRSQKWEYEFLPKLISRENNAVNPEEKDILSLKILQNENKWYGDFKCTCRSSSNSDVQVSPEA